MGREQGVQEMSGKMSDHVAEGGAFRWDAGGRETWTVLPPGGANPCFAAGTNILTLRGEVAVEDVMAGDAVITVREDGPEFRRVVRTERRGVDVTRHPEPALARPIRICAGAFEPGLPIHDLRLSPTHAVVVEGEMIEARSLVNGATIIQECGTTHVTYHHIALDQHDVLLAEGLPVESCLDAGETCLAGSGHGLVQAGEWLAGVRERLLTRAEALGFARADAVELVAVAGGQTIRPVANQQTLTFVLPAETTVIELMSPGGVPAHLANSDGGRPGITIAGLTLVDGNRRIRIDLADAAQRGARDPDGGAPRWNVGEALIALPQYAGPAVLEVMTGMAAGRANPAPPAQPI